jgi:hypothetical protein
MFVVNSKVKIIMAMDAYGALALHQILDLVLLPILPFNNVYNSYSYNNITHVYSLAQYSTMIFGISAIAACRQSYRGQSLIQCMHAINKYAGNT